MMVKQQPLIIEDTKTSLKEEKPKEKIGLLGGTFNPPHMGHLVVADQVRNQLGLEEVWFIPTSTPPHQDGKETIDSEHRLDMLVRAIAGNSYFDLNTIEVDNGGKNYTHDTVVALQERHPDKEFYFIVGADMVQDLPTWYRIDDLMKLVQFVGVNRLHYEEKTDYPIIWVNVPNVDISSTELRQAFREGNPVRYLIPSGVISYIVEKGLYLENEE